MSISIKSDLPELTHPIETELPPGVVIHNVVATMKLVDVTTKLPLHLDLNLLAHLLPHATLRYDRYPRLRVRLLTIPMVIVVHASGTMISMGARGERAEAQAMDGLRHVGWLIFHAGYRSARPTDFKVTNILACGDVAHCIDLLNLHRRSGIVQLPHEMSLHLDYPVPESPCHAKIFHTGRYNLIGGTTRQHLIQVVEHVRALVEGSKSTEMYQPLPPRTHRKPVPNLKERRSRWMMCGK